MTTVELSAATFEQTVSGEGIVLVDFWAAWCGPCRQFAPVFEKASEDNPDIVFGKVDTEAEQRAWPRWPRSRSIPTLMLFRDGILLFNQAGAMPPQALDRLIEPGPRAGHGRRTPGGGRRAGGRRQRSAGRGRPRRVRRRPQPGAYVVDVREDAELAGGHVPGAVPHPDVRRPGRGSPSCRRASRSSSSASPATAAARSSTTCAPGHQAINVAGGTGGWAQRGWPLEG